ncbi:hypothetical protein VNO78_17270 [Psophocarpus tetragonolobus]|uniref:Histidine-containing phosphotransfer protein n=1 Tax=Psophocarpus tetragonolobus TaxID=3891 RepID=A0AAN9XLA4_PSOTE
MEIHEFTGLQTLGPIVRKGLDKGILISVNTNQAWNSLSSCVTFILIWQGEMKNVKAQLTVFTHASPSIHVDGCIFSQTKTIMDLTLLQREHRDYQTTMLREGFLDDQFNQLQKLQDETIPYFAMEVVTIFFGESEKLINSIALALVGAARIKDVCTDFRTICEAQNIEGCMNCLQKLQLECSLLQNKLQYLFRLQQEIQAAGGSISPVE